MVPRVGDAVLDVPPPPARPLADPDGLHLHTLVYRRVVRLRNPVARSALTTLCLLALNVFTILPAWLFWDETWILQAYAAGFVLVYLWIYLRVARFGLPLGQIRRERKGAPSHERDSVELH